MTPHPDQPIVDLLAELMPAKYGYLKGRVLDAVSPYSITVIACHFVGHEHDFGINVADWFHTENILKMGIV